MKLPKRILLHILIIVCILQFPLLFPSARAGTETLITTNTTGSDQQAPSISGDWIMWEDTRNTGWDIYGYNIVTGEERRITRDGAIAHDPALSGTSVVWQDYRNGNYDIYASNLVTGTETRITSGTAPQTAPAIDGSRIVWQDMRSGNSEIYLYDLVTLTETLITPGVPGVNKHYPAIAGNLVVWQDDRNNPSRSDIFMNDTATNTVSLLTPGLPASSQMKPAISGTRVVWKDEQVTSRGTIVMNDTSSLLMTRIDNGPSTAGKNRPVISGTRIVWLDSRNRSPAFYDIYMNDTATGQNIRITTGEAQIQPWQDEGIGYPVIGPSLYGNRIVWTDFRNGDRDIYLYTDGVTESCPVAGFAPSVQAGSVPLTVQFTDTSVPGSTPVSHWHWEFGDGNTSDEQNPLFTFNRSGNYQVRLTIDNPYCRNATPIDTAYTISVGAAPVAAFTATPSSGFSPLLVSFVDSSLAATAWNWSFGDGTYAEVPSPTHTYLNPGTYTVRLNASNTWGFSPATTTIHVLGGAEETADTTIDGIVITDRSGFQHLSYNTTILPVYTHTGSLLICTDPALLAHGWQNITFLSGDGTGFVPSGSLIEGTISRVIFSTREITPAGFSRETGAACSINYSTSVPSYPVGGSLTTQVWEGALPSDLGKFRTIATLSNYLGVYDLAYTIKITRTRFPSGGTATIHFNVNTSWVARLPDGRNHVFLERISDDGLTGEVLQPRYLFEDTTRDLDVFETDSPRGLSTFGVSLLTGSGNPFQLITLTVASHISPPVQENDQPSGSDSDSNPAGGAGGGKVTVPVKTLTTTTPPTPGPTVDPGISAKVYTNANGVVTQATRLRSNDGRALVVIGEGVVAKDAGGTPLPEITVKVLPPASLPALPSGSTVMFAGMACEIGPDGATFSPPVSLSFTLPRAQWGEDYTVKFFDQKSGTWRDLPTAFDATTGTVTAQFSHLCVFALFTQPRASPVTPQATTPVPVPSALQVKAEPPTTAVSIFANMLGWVAGPVMNNAIVPVAVIILAIAVFLAKKGKFPGSGR